MLEVEVKLKVDLEKIENTIIDLGFEKGACVYEHDTYYNGHRLNLKEADKALRIREYKNMDLSQVRYVMNYKGPKVDDITMTREEVEFEILSFKAGDVMLSGLGFYSAGSVEKTRIYYTKDDITCCLDTVTGLGDYLEVEIMAEKSDYDEAISRIAMLLKSLGLSIDDTVRQSYLCLLGY